MLPVPDLVGFVCGTCGKWHKGLPLDYAYAAPDFWSKDMETHLNCFINDDFCVVRQEHFFVRSLTKIPTLGRDEPFRGGCGVPSASRTLTA